MITFQIYEIHPALIMATILCLGISGSGKSMLLHCLKERCLALSLGLVPEDVVVDDDDAVKQPPPLLMTVPTVGTDLVRLQKPGAKGTPQSKVCGSII